MLYDVRTYTCRPGTLAKQFELYGEFGFEVQKRHLGEPLVFGAAETGLINSYIHIWGYEDAADRMHRRNAMNADPEWQTYLAKSAEAGYIIRQENSQYLSAPFVK